MRIQVSMAAKRLLAVVGLAGLVVLAADDQVIDAPRAGIEPDVVVGIGHVPVERVGQAVAQGS